MQLNKYILPILAIALSSCSLFKYIHVLLHSVSFDVDTDANLGSHRAFSCHVVIAYTEDMNKQIAGMDAKSYFNNVPKFERDYVDVVQIVKFDLMPGQTLFDQKIDIKSRFRAKGAYVVAKYQGNGNTKATIGKMPVIIVKCKRNGIEILNPISYSKKYNEE